MGELKTSLEELQRLHRTFIDSRGVTGTVLDLIGFDLRSAGAFTGACLTMLAAPHAVFYRIGSVEHGASGCALWKARLSRVPFRRRIELAAAMLNGA